MLLLFTVFVRIDAIGRVIRVKPKVVRAHSDEGKQQSRLSM